MKEERFFYVPNLGDSNELPQEEAVHATRVLRLSEGDEIFLMDGKGNFFRAEITMASNKRCSYSIVETLPQDPIWNGRIHLAMAPTKMMERVEWFAEKATEIGCDEFSFLECKFSERRNMRQDRVDKIVIGATKQSRKAWKPIVNELMPFKKFIDEERDGLKLIAHCHEDESRQDLYDLLTACNDDQLSSGVTMLIGPEGDFSPEEVAYAVEHGYKSISLGCSRLRTETAALSAVMTAQLVLRKK